MNPPDRTRLTRKNLDAIEQRCNRLEALIRSLHPGMDIDVALANLEAGQEVIRRTEQESDDDSPEHEEPAHEYEWSEPSLPPDFDCQNDEAGAMDGMATLNSLDAGYLGMSSYHPFNHLTKWFRI